MRSFLAILVTATTLAILSTACDGQYIYSVDYKLPGCSATTGNDWTAIQVYPLDTCLRESNAAFNNYVRITGNSTHYGSQACNSTIAGCECGPSQCAPLVLPFFVFFPVGWELLLTFCTFCTFSHSLRLLPQWRRLKSTQLRHGKLSDRGHSKSLLSRLRNEDSDDTNLFHQLL
jgi:hypothetical protein